MTPEGRLRQSAAVQQPATRQGAQERVVTTVQPYWLNLTVPFTGVANEQKQGFTLPEDFPYLVRGAWTTLSGARARLQVSGTKDRWSTEEVPILSLAGASNLVHPYLYYRHPWLLRPQSTIRGDFLNDGVEAAGRMVFIGEKANYKRDISVRKSQIWWLRLNLGLSGGATGRGTVKTTAIEDGLLVWGATSTSTGSFIRLFDTSRNWAWSTDQLPVGAFCGIVGQIQPVLFWKKPYYLPAQAQIKVEWLNSGAETGKFISLLCERVLEPALKREDFE